MELNYESLRKWFKQEDWVRIDTQGNISGKCGTMKKGKAKTRCLPRKRAQGMSKAERKATVAKKVRGSKKGKQYVKVKENMDKKELKNIILKTLEKEGGAAGIKALAKASKTSKDKLKKSLAKMTGVKQHQDGDYISTPISEEKTIKGVHKGPTPNSQYCECHITENGVTTIQLVYCSAKYCNKDVCCHPDYLGRTKTPTDIDMDMDMMDKGMDDVNVAGGIPHFTYPERHSGYLEENKNNLTNNKMAKENLNERFQELAGIKPLYEGEDNVKEMDKEEVYEMLMNEGPELWTALGGLMSVLGAAGIVTSLEMLVQDEAMKEKYPKLAKMFDILAKVGGAVGKGIK